MISLHKAKKALEASEAKAKELGITVTTVIVDGSGLIIASSRMDNALPVSPRFAFTKAFTAAVLRMPTNVLADFAIPGKPYFGITSIYGGEFTTIPGGIPIQMEKAVVGGVGVGGGEPPQDVQCAEAALKVLSE